MKNRTKVLSLFMATLLFTHSGAIYAGGGTQKPTSKNGRGILLLHGLFGAGDSILGGPYFPDLPPWIGDTTGVYPLIPNLGKGDLNSQYEIAIKAMNAACADCRWDILGHSRGGIVARMIMKNNPEKVHSITTVASPHRGCWICDQAEGSQVLKDFFKIFGQDVTGQVLEMSQANMEKFNTQYPAGVPDGVKLCKDRKDPSGYKSTITIGGKSFDAASLVGNRFGTTREEFTAYLANIADPTYYGNQILGSASAGSPNYSSKNDGVVATCSAGFGATGTEGMILGATDHNDMVFQLVRMSDGRGIAALKTRIKEVWNNP